MIKVAGPYGTFIGDPAVETPILCMAAGSGLAPILSLTETALRRGFKQPVRLLFSARRAEDVYAQGIMSYLQARHRRFRFMPTLTGEQREGMLQGRIPDLLPELFPDLSTHSIFIAGAPDFVESCRQAALARGAQPELIHTEGYYPRAAAQSPRESQLVHT